jgi:hypothetical protein
LEITEDAGGRYFGFSDTNAAFSSPDGSILWFTVPDGFSNQSVSVRYTNVDSIEPNIVVENLALMACTPIWANIPERSISTYIQRLTEISK